ncbi:MAG: hypothetical protein ABI939_05970 [Anaerolineaceae bacterium]
MKLSLEVVSRDGDEVVLRLVAFNDSSKPAEFDRRALVGPNGVPATQEPWPVSLEPAARDANQNTVLLSAFCLYGRERRFTIAEPTTFHGYLVSRPGGGLLSGGPAHAKQLVAAAQSLALAPGS